MSFTPAQNLLFNVCAGYGTGYLVGSVDSVSPSTVASVFAIRQVARLALQLFITQDFPRVASVIGLNYITFFVLKELNVFSLASGGGLILDSALAGAELYDIRFKKINCITIKGIRDVTF